MSNERRNRRGVINPQRKEFLGGTPPRGSEVNSGRRWFVAAGILAPVVVFSALAAENQGLTNFHESEPQNDRAWLLWAANKLGFQQNATETKLWFENDFAPFPTNIALESIEAKLESERRLNAAYNRMGDSSIPLLSGTAISLSNHYKNNNIEFRPTTTLPSNAPFDQFFEEINGRVTAVLGINSHLLQNGTTVHDLANVLVRGLAIINSRIGTINQLRSTGLSNNEVIQLERQQATTTAQQAKLKDLAAQAGSSAYIAVYGSSRNIQSVGERSFLDQAFFKEATVFAKARMEAKNPIWQDYIYNQPGVSQ